MKIEPNADAIDRIIEEIKAEEIAKFNMTYWGNDADSPNGCGTCACIGGFTEMIMLREQNLPFDFGDVPEEDIIKFIGIEWDVGQKLFYAIRASKVSLSDITAEMAVQALEDIKGGKTFTCWDDYAYMMKEMEEA
jgi:hypothetical protein